ncbi:MAG: hypothetical protein GEV08_09010 [Acidimicrobiia bacterium]|nr:hypothetical protein [Acidimicrobiia bacterium]
MRRVVAGVLAGTGLAVVVLAGGGCRQQGSREAFCAQVVEVPVVSDADTLVAPGGEDLLDGLLEGLEDLHDASPGEVRPDVGTLVSVTKDLREVLREADPERADEETLAELRSGLAYYGAASERVVAYTSRTCGIDLTTVTATPTITTTD